MSTDNEQQPDIDQLQADYIEAMRLHAYHRRAAKRLAAPTARDAVARAKRFGWSSVTYEPPPESRRLERLAGAYADDAQELQTLIDQHAGTRPA